MATANSIRALRALQLPHKNFVELSCADALDRVLQGLGVVDSDMPAWVDLELARWMSENSPSVMLRDVVHQIAPVAAMGESEHTRVQYIAIIESYFSLHSSLLLEHGLSFAEATSALSHASLMLHLVSVESLSAAQVARVLAPKDVRAKFSRQVVSQILSSARAAPTLTPNGMQKLFAEDARQELGAFGDASFETAAMKVAEVARQFGFQQEFEKSLLALSPFERDGKIISQRTPYLQILHYQCCIAEHYDHAMVDLYEFSPRGVVADWLFNKYPNSIAGASNPFLNNAKAVEVIDEGWVRSKRSAERSGARAIYQLLSMMDGMGFSARREIARWVRMWLLRIVRVANEMPIEMPVFLRVDEVRQLLGLVAQRNTATFGIIEQRVLDAVASLSHPNWRSRGVGDAVNATNVSSAKLGDCEFIDAHRREIHAYEAHGGALTDIYIQKHLLSLRKSISARVDELTSVADIEDWRVTINFVAHGIDNVSEVDERIDGLQVRVVPRTFAEVFADVNYEAEAQLVSAFRDHVVVPMTQRRTPNIARSTLLDFSGLGRESL